MSEWSFATAVFTYAVTHTIVSATVFAKPHSFFYGVIILIYKRIITIRAESLFKKDSVCFPFVTAFKTLYGLCIVYYFVLSHIEFWKVVFVIHSRSLRLLFFELFDY